MFWIGIGHAGTLDLGGPVPLPPALAHLGQPGRRGDDDLRGDLRRASIPLIHMGRPWFALLDVPATSTRAARCGSTSGRRWSGISSRSRPTSSISLDLLVHRDGPRSGHDPRPGLKPGIWRKRDHGRASALGWNGSYRTWLRYETVYLLLAGLATPLVISVHTIVSWDFATSVIPGWHTTIFPPYFVAGAVFSGMAMVLTLMLIARKTMHLEDYITQASTSGR